MFTESGSVKKMEHLPLENLRFLLIAEKLDI